MARKKKDSDYIDNDRFKEVTTRYIAMYDDASWCGKYIQRMESRKVPKDRYDQAMAFIARRRASAASRKPDQYSRKEMDETATEFTYCLMQIANGLIRTMSLTYDPDIDDIRQEAVYTGLKYYARFDELSGTSCFAFFTQILKNSILLYLEDRKKEHLDGMIIPESELIDTRGVDEFDVKESE